MSPLHDNINVHNTKDFILINVLDRVEWRKMVENGLMVTWHTKNLYSSIYFQNYLIITHRAIHKKNHFSYFALSIIVDIKSFIHLNIYVKAISLTDYRSKHVREYYMKNDWPTIVISRSHVLCNISNHSSSLILPVAKGKCKIDLYLSFIKKYYLKPLKS